MKRYTGESADDVSNHEAWCVVFEHLLWLVPPDARMRVLQLAIAHEEAELAEAAEHDGLRVISAAELLNMDTPGLRHWHTVMRLKSLVVQVFVRTISNNHASRDAAAILFADHRFGTGSGQLSDYLRKHWGTEK